tara:strand:+ start:603 stop:926 length:324 start_codon:yes stop_codon:yes gene_type:complete
MVIFISHLYIVRKKSFILTTEPKNLILQNLDILGLIFPAMPRCQALKSNGKQCRQCGKPTQSGGEIIDGFCMYHSKYRNTERITEPRPIVNLKIRITKNVSEKEKFD